MTLRRWVGLDEPDSLAIAEQRMVFDWIFTALPRSPFHAVPLSARGTEKRNDVAVARCDLFIWRLN